MQCRRSDQCALFPIDGLSEARLRTGVVVDALATTATDMITIQPRQNRKSFQKFRNALEHPKTWGCQVSFSTTRDVDSQLVAIAQLSAAVAETQRIGWYAVAFASLRDYAYDEAPLADWTFLL